MSQKTFVTESEITFHEAFYMPGNRFVWLNMWRDGIWYVDTEHSEWDKIKETALAIAKTFGDTKTIKKLKNL